MTRKIIFDLGRRSFLKKAALTIGTGIAISASPFIIPPALAISASPFIIPPALAIEQGDLWSRPRDLWVSRKTVGSHRILYWQDGKYLKEGYEALCYCLRDVEYNVIAPIKHKLLDAMWMVQQWAYKYRIINPYTVLSCYRVNEHNNRLEGAAKDGEHTKGAALDSRIEGLTASQHAGMVRYIQAGGCGYYVNRKFTHMDIGPVRFWQGN